MVSLRWWMSRELKYCYMKQFSLLRRYFHKSSYILFRVINCKGIAAMLGSNKHYCEATTLGCLFGKSLHESLFLCNSLNPDWWVLISCQHCESHIREWVSLIIIWGNMAPPVCKNRFVIWQLRMICLVFVGKSVKKLGWHLWYFLVILQVNLIKDYK